MKRFGQEEDREFEIAGEVFKWVYPYWEDMANVFDKDTAEASKNGDAIVLTVHGTIADFQKRIELFIDPEYNDGITRWRALCKRKKNPIPHAQYSQLYGWLLEVTSGMNPTEPLSPSESGPQPTEAT